jgi:curved DNA-binding protein CbpA
MDVYQARELLGLRVGAGRQEILEGFRLAVKRAHPDVGGTQQEFERVVAAKNFLLSCSKRSLTGKMSETEFTSHVSKVLRDEGAVVFKVHGHAMQQSGWPDLQVYHSRWTGHLELKVEGNDLTTLQSMVIRDLKKRGTKAYVLRLAAGIVTLEDDGKVKWGVILSEFSLSTIVET